MKVLSVFMSIVTVFSLLFLLKSQAPAFMMTSSRGLLLLQNQFKKELISLPPCNDPCNCGPGPDVRPPLTLVKVVIDAGHGGSDGGAVRDGVVEKTLTLSIIDKFRKGLEEQGGCVILTRPNDVFYGLDERVGLALSVNADMFISVHVNAVPEQKSDVHGVQTFYTTDVSKPLASFIQQSLVDKLKVPDLGIHQRDLYVTKNTGTLPSALTEVGFITNSQERKLLASSDYQQKIADALVQAVLNFVADKKNPKKPSAGQALPTCPAPGSEQQPAQHLD